MYEDNNNRPSVDNGSNANPTSNPYNYSGRSYNYAGGNSYSANNGSNPYSYNNQSYSYGQNSYNYNQNAQPTYGTYQYNSQAGGSVPPERPKKKKHTFAKIVAAICILALIVGGVGITYNTVVNKSGNFLGIGGNDTVAEVEQQDEEITPEDTGADPVTEDKAQAEPEKEIQTTTVTGA